MLPRLRFTEGVVHAVHIRISSVTGIVRFHIICTAFLNVAKGVQALVGFTHISCTCGGPI